MPIDWAVDGGWNAKVEVEVLLFHKTDANLNCLGYAVICVPAVRVRPHVLDSA